MLDSLAGKHYLYLMTFRDRLTSRDYLYCGEPFCDGDHISSNETCAEEPRFSTDDIDEAIDLAMDDPLDHYWSGTGESMGDDSYIDYLNRN